ncbi:MAG: DUF1292 domain-containing protein [Bacilli bacterium]|nr:DUF1292 domain-containing protein [Bacilli bacterium]
MEIKNDTQMVVADSEGKEHLMQILFTYENDERKAQYVFFYDTEDPEENVIVMRYIGELDSGELEPIEDDEEYEEVEEVFNAWQEDPKIQDLKKA